MIEWTSQNLVYCATVLASIAFFQLVKRVTVVKASLHFIPTYFSSFSPKSRHIFTASVASSVNAIIMFIASIYIFYYYDLHTEIFWTDSLPVRMLTCFEMGYFISDSINIILDGSQPGEYLFLLHHLSLIAVALSVVVFKVLAFHTCLRCMNELSVPFMNIRWALAELKLQNTRLYFINGLIFTISFFLCRVCVIPLCIYTAISDIDGFNRLNAFCALTFVLSATVVDGLNIYWFRLIAKGAIKLIRKKLNKTAVKEE